MNVDRVAEQLLARALRGDPGARADIRSSRDAELGGALCAALLEADVPEQRIPDACWVDARRWEYRRARTIEPCPAGDGPRWCFGRRGNPEALAHLRLATDKLQALYVRRGQHPELALVEEAWRPWNGWSIDQAVAAHDLRLVRWGVGVWF